MGEKEGGEKKEEIGGDNELGPVRLHPGLGISREYLPPAFLAEGSFIKGKEHSKENNGASSPGQLSPAETGVTLLRQPKAALQLVAILLSQHP